MEDVGDQRMMPSCPGSFEHYDMLHSLMPELLKRLDDNDNDIRWGRGVIWDE